MEILITNPGFHHLAFKVFEHLDYKTLNTLSLVSKKFNEFMSQREIWIRTLNKIQIIQESNESENCQNSGESFQTLLLHYKKESHLKELKNFVKLMEKHCNNRKLNEAIEEAIESENMEFIELFLQAPPGLKTIYPISFSNLGVLATEDKKFKLFKYILVNADNWNLKPFQVEDNEYTLLHFAAFFSNVEAVKLILNHKDFNERVEQVTPLGLSLTNKTFEVVRAMVESPKINVNQNGYLHSACEFETTDYVKLFLERSDIDVNIMAPYGYTPLYNATDENGNAEIVKLLLQREDIDVNLGADDGVTPLHNACFNGNTEIVDLLLNAQDIDVNARNSDGDSPLHFACLEGRFQVVKVLLENKNIDVNIQGEEGMTPLHDACEYGHIEIVKMLLQVPNIKIDVKDFNDQTPLDYAKTNAYEEIVKILEYHNKNPN